MHSFPLGGAISGLIWLRIAFLLHLHTTFMNVAVSVLNGDGHDFSGHHVFWDVTLFNYTWEVLNNY